MDCLTVERIFNEKAARIMYSFGALSTALIVSSISLATDEKNCLQRSFFPALRNTPGERENKKLMQGRVSYY